MGTLLSSQFLKRMYITKAAQATSKPVVTLKVLAFMLEAPEKTGVAGVRPVIQTVEEALVVAVILIAQIPANLFGNAVREARRRGSKAERKRLCGNKDRGWI